MSIKHQSGPTIGQMVRALRVGFGLVHNHGCFMRLSGGDVTGQPFCCELHPIGLIPNDYLRKGQLHWVWWSGQDSPGINVEMIEGLRLIRRVKLPIRFYFDDNGKTL